MGWVLPVGTPVGVCSGFADMSDARGVVRLGGELMYLDTDIYRLWLAAVTAPAPAELLAWAPGKGIADAEQHLPSLLSTGLMIVDGGDVQERVGRLAFHLVGECIGNGPDRDVKFGVIGGRGARLDVDVFSFEVLLRGDGVTPLSAICAALDERPREPGSRSSLARLVEGLPLLVRAGVVRLDAVLAP